jgi:hypothetical protein
MTVVKRTYYGKGACDHAPFPLVFFSSFFPEGQASAIQVGTPSRGRIILLSTIQKARKPPIISNSFIGSPPGHILPDIQKAE